ncbi:hypothetical protein ACQEV2_42940 [Streptomyces sp. CA-251387]|uniref:hypothetical protein n=1 Tax=Streptomyces sp. CA-251387 TaxID=3240064 RepID=UPI003D8B9078
MNQDETLAAALSEAAAGVPVGTAPTAAVMHQGKMIRRRHKAMRSAVVAAAVLVPAVGVAFSATFDPSSTPQVPAASTAVKVVAPGERIAGAGNKLWLTAKGLHVVAPKSSGTDKPDVMRVADVLPGKVSTIARGGASGVLWAGIYRGPVTATTKVTVKLGARTLQAKVVTLAGKPGWGAYYVLAAKGKADMKPSITVQDADGAILASLAKSGKS